MDQDQPPKPKRRFRFSLRTLMIVVLVYAGLWALTAVWGGCQLEKRVGVYSNNPKRVNQKVVKWWKNQNDPGGEKPDSLDAIWYADSVAWAPFLVKVDYAYSKRVYPPSLKDMLSQDWNKPGPECASVIREHVWVFWFFGFRRTLAGTGFDYGPFGQRDEPDIRDVIPL
jgi:hypothetical protein